MILDDRGFDRFFKLVSDFIDQELDFELLDEFERDMEDEFCRCFFNTFQKTVELCHELEMEEVPEELHISLMDAIQETTKVRFSPVRKRKKSRKR